MKGILKGPNSFTYNLPKHQWNIFDRKQQTELIYMILSEIIIKKSVWNGVVTQPYMSSRSAL